MKIEVDVEHYGDNHTVNVTVWDGDERMAFGSATVVDGGSPDPTASAMTIAANSAVGDLRGKLQDARRILRAMDLLPPAPTKPAPPESP